MPRRPQPKTLVGDDGRRRIVHKNANGEGSLFFAKEVRRTLQDGTESVRAAHWRATYTDPVTGKRRAAQGRTREEAERRRRAAIERAEEHRPRGTRFSRATPVGELAAWWLDNVAVDQVRAGSLDKYRERVAHFGFLALLPLREVSRESVTEWQRALLVEPTERTGRPLTPSSVADVRTTLRQVLAYAVESGVLAANPVDSVRRPAVRREPGRVLSTQEVASLLAATDRSRYGPVVRLLFSSGLRVSEALGLAWPDVELDGGRATVRQAVVYSKASGAVLGPPKTDRALGEHHLAPAAVKALRRWRRAQAEERLRAGEAWEVVRYHRSPVDLAFTTESGGLVRRQHIDTLLRRAARQVGIDTSHLGTHVGRRTVVTTLYAAGVELADIARHVGHASTATTAGYVAHLGDRPERTAEVAARLLDPPMK